MERLNLRLASALARLGPLAVCGPRGCSTALPAKTRVVEVPAERISRFMLGALPAALHLARRQRSHIVIAGSGLSAPFAYICARAVGASYIVYLHGLDLVADSLVYRMGWLPFIRRADLALVNSRNTQRLAERAGVLRSEVLYPGTDFPSWDLPAANRFREKLGLGQSPLLLSVGRLTPRKGLGPFIRETLPAIVAECPGTRLLIIGEDAVHAAKADSGSERERVQAAIREVGLTDAVMFLPHCPDAELIAAYQAADVHVFPVLDVQGDVEGFGMVAVEAAANGLPTVAFRAGGVPDAIMEGATGDLIPAGDYQAFASAVVRRLASAGEPAEREAIRAAAMPFGWDRFNARLADLLNGMGPHG
jgi:phosphatidylinositol alpha-1,6-mannosyltransferase